ncbi:hypothetical protein V8D89_009314 [Ganoderma adspersum]
MWMLSTDRAELHHFQNGPDTVAGSYATLSHLWDREEPSFQDMQQLQALCRNNARALAAHHAFGPVMSPNPRDHVPSKIRNACIAAQKQGCQWLWADTCCVERVTAASVSDAVGGAYGLYYYAKVCLAYLADVSHASVHAQFPASRWHGRAWTLPELVAPKSVVFFSREWAYIGVKQDLAAVLESTIRVPARVMTRQDAPSKYSVAERMTWAGGRRTTREEDRAYSLMGLFDVRMSARYGEGASAFPRIQQKIAQKTMDMSLFSWGRRVSWNWFCRWISSVQPRQAARYFSDGNLLAPSPDHFLPARAISSAGSLAAVVQDRSARVPQGQQAVPGYTLAKAGELIFRLPVFETGTFSVAIICCSDTDGFLALFVNPSPSFNSVDTSAPIYQVGRMVDGTGSSSHTARVITLGHDLNALSFAGHRVTFVWKALRLL